MNWSNTSLLVLSKRQFPLLFCATLFIAQILLFQIVRAQGNWTQQVSPATQSLYIVKAVNQNVAWAAGNGGTVIRTIDDSTWTKVDGGAFGTNPLYYLCAINTNTALISISKATNENAPRLSSDTTWIYRTTNGGSSWQIVFQQIGGLIEDMQMIDSLNGIAFGDPTPGDSTLTVLRTRDGGAHWSRIATGPAVTINTPQSAEVGWARTMTATDTNHIWFATAVTPSGAGIWIRRTTDGGKTWDRITFPRYFPGHVTFTDSLQGLFSWWSTSSNIQGCDRTTDGGQSWTTVFSHSGMGASSNPVTSLPGGRFWMTDSSNVYEFNASDPLVLGLPSARIMRLSCPTIYWIDMKKSAGSLYGWLVTQNGKIYKYEPLRWQFKKYAGNPILTTGAAGSFDAKYILSPNVLYVKGMYHMWYEAASGTNNYSVGYATSPDGITWTKYAGNPVLQLDPSPSAFDGKAITSPRVHWDGQRFHMLYLGQSTSNILRMGYAYSSDGIHWTKNPTFVLDVGALGTWDGAGVGPGAFMKEGAKWELWYDAVSSTGEWRTGYASANDSVHWTKHPSMAPVIDKGAAGEWDADGPIADCVIKASNDYHVWYENNADTQIGYAVSHDGITWNKSLANPVLSPTPGTWDQGGVEWAWMIRSGKKHFLYYASKGAVTSIGLAIDSTTEFPDTTNQTLDTGIPNYSEAPRTYALSQNFPNPFNPTTNFEFRIAEFGFVSLKVYDLLGREVATLVKELKQAGTHHLQWDASRLSSGVYFYRLQSGSFVETRKLVLLR